MQTYAYVLRNDDRDVVFDYLRSQAGSNPLSRGCG